MSKQEILTLASIQPEKKRTKIARVTEFVPIELPEGSRKERVRVGRGRSSGLGKTCGRGQKGQKARSGYSHRAGFEGGQMPLHRRVPKRGFTNIFKEQFQVVNLWMLSKHNLTGEVGPEQMEKLGLVAKASDLIKVLGSGELSTSIQIVADAFSASARDKIAAAGGKCTLRSESTEKQQ